MRGVLNSSGHRGYCVKRATAAPAASPRRVLLSPPQAPQRPRRASRRSVPLRDSQPGRGGGSSGDGSSSSTAAGESALPPARLSFEEAAAALLAGRSFKCTVCGKCCTMEDDGEVWVSRAEIRDMAAFLGITESQLIENHCQPHEASGIPGWWLLQSTRAPSGEAFCTFLDATTNMCRVHAARPVQCSTYPWWPELLAERGAWDWEAKHICEGLDHPEAEALDLKDAMEQLRRATRHELARQRAAAGAVGRGAGDAAGGGAGDAGSKEKGGGSSGGGMPGQ